MPQTNLWWYNDVKVNKTNIYDELGMKPRKLTRLNEKTR